MSQQRSIGLRETQPIGIDLPPLPPITPPQYYNNIPVVWVPEWGKFYTQPGIATGDLGLESTDGLTWTSINIGASDADRNEGICYSPDLGLLIYSQPAFDESANIYLSSDGDTWTPYYVLGVTQPHDGGFAETWKLCWSPELGIFCMGLRSAGVDPAIATSPDGITWTAQNSPWNAHSYNFADFQDVCWSSPLGLFVAVGGGNHFGNIAPSAIISSDGSTWTAASSPPGAGNSPVCVMWSDVLSKFIVGCNDGTIWTSSDGDTWTISDTSAVTPAAISSLAESTELGILVASTENLTDFPYGQQMMRSTDGDTWLPGLGSSLSFVSILPSGVCWSPDLAIFCCVGQETVPSIISSDGIHWHH